MEADRHMLAIGITPPRICPDEARRISAWLESGLLDYVHIRHPEASARQIGKLAESIPSRLRHRLALHDHYEIAHRLGIGGLHLNSRHPRCPALPDGYAPRISRSCHSLDELAACRDIDYAFLSPIFDSISKSGYSSAFPPSSHPAMVQAIASAPCRVVALGGVTPEAFELLRSLGFAGGAMLGYLWES